jgi:hypothetical protein
VVKWEKANLSDAVRKKTLKAAGDDLPAYGTATLLERVKSRFRRARLN